MTNILGYLIVSLIAITRLAVAGEGYCMDPVNKIELTDKEWKERLTPEQYKVLRKGGTEPAFKNEYADLKKDGIYDCRGCDLPLYSSKAKFDSGTGWPSFYEPICPNHVTYKDDYHLFSKRTEIRCARCDSHIGHVFDDGPPPTGKRYCMNSAALRFVPGKTYP